MAAQPRVIRNFNLFVNGGNFAGICEEVTLPALKVITDEHRAGGMDSATLIDLGVERLEIKFTLAEHSPDIFRQFGLMNGNDVMLLFRAARKGGESIPSPYTVTVRGMYSEITPAGIKTGEKSGMEATISCRYYRLEIDGEVVIEIDVDNFKRIIGGVDQLAGIRDIIDA